MCGWLSYVSIGADKKGWMVLDLFCGAARISRLAARIGLRTASIDVNVPGAKISKMVGKKRKKQRRFPGPKRNLMDINGHVGFPFLARKGTTF